MSQKKLRIGIVGCGAIGGSLARTILRRFSANARLTALFDIDAQKSRSLAGRCGNLRLAKRSLGELLQASEFVVEATSRDASYAVASAALSASCDVMVMSVGGVLGKVHALRKLACARRRTVYIPSGAVAGIDGIKAAAAGRITRLTLTTTKPLRALRGAPGLKALHASTKGSREEAVVFQGNALQASRAFPQNINVAATVSLAGFGARRTRVRILASKKAVRNIHELHVESTSGSMSLRTENRAHPDNPKTSYQAVLSAVACLSQVMDPIKIGT